MLYHYNLPEVLEGLMNISAGKSSDVWGKATLQLEIFCDELLSLNTEKKRQF